MKKVTVIISILFMSMAALAQLPSWGMTQQQYRMPNHKTKLAEIGAQAAEHNWQLKITAPKDWHNEIRSGLTQDGAINVMMVVQDSLHNSISIIASEAKQMGRTVNPVSQQMVKKQAVVNDEIEIDTTVERPDFDEEFSTDKPALAEVELDMELLQPNHQNDKKEETNTIKPVEAETPSKELETTQTEIQPKKDTEETIVSSSVATMDLEDTKNYLRKRYAKNRRVDNSLPYSSIEPEDELYMKDGLVLVVRENNNRPFYYWMNELFDPQSHNLKNTSHEKFTKINSDTENNETTSAVESKVVKTMNQTAENRPPRTHKTLDFKAIIGHSDDQSILKKKHTKNKGVRLSIKPSELQKGDKLFVQNETVLVIRQWSDTNILYFWLEGDTSLIKSAALESENEFIIN